MGYIENPKTAGSGIICCIPQTGICPHNCPDCFFQSGRSYLEPLCDHLPNIPTLEQVGHRIVRVNDGNDSNVNKKEVIEKTKHFKHMFYNTSVPDLDGFDAPVVLTVNPGQMTDESFHSLDPDNIPTNLMFVRARVNMWNQWLINDIVYHYTQLCQVPVVLTFMAYFKETIPQAYKEHYILRTRTLNKYHAISNVSWRGVMNNYQQNILVYSCGTEGISGSSKCSRCGNCLREYFNTLERMKLLDTTPEG